MTNAVDALQGLASQASNIYNVVVPVAIGIIAFVILAPLVKKLLRR
jgi:hypothetical protein